MKDVVKKHIDRILTKQFSMVGLSYKKNKKLVNQEGWYLTHCWSQQQEDKFKKWLIRYFSKPKVRDELAIYSPKRMAELWILDYGWMVCDEIENTKNKEDYGQK